MERLENIVIHRIWTTRFGRARLAARAIDYASFYSGAFGGLLRLARRGDVIIAMTDPPLLSVSTLPTAAIRGAVQINWLQDLFPEVAISLGVIRAGIVSGLLVRLRNWSLRHAVRNVAIGERMAARLSSQRMPAGRVNVIHNWADGMAISPLDPAENTLRAEWNLAEQFVVGYSGNLGRAHDFATILAAAERLRDVEHIRFLIIGAGHQLESVRAEVLRRDLPNVILKPFQPACRLREALTAPDLHLVSLLPDLEGLIVPSKFYGVAAAGRPSLFLGSRSGEISELIRAGACGAVVAIGNVEELVEQIEGLARSPARRATLARNARVLFTQRFDRPIALAKWSTVIAEVAAAMPQPRSSGGWNTRRREVAR